MDSMQHMPSPSSRAIKTAQQKAADAEKKVDVLSNVLKDIFLALDAHMSTEEIDAIFALHTLDGNDTSGIAQWLETFRQADLETDLIEIGRLLHRDDVKKVLKHAKNGTLNLPEE